MLFGGRRGIGDIILLTGELGDHTTGTITMAIITIGIHAIILITTVLTIIATTIGKLTTIVRFAHIQ